MGKRGLGLFSKRVLNVEAVEIAWKLNGGERMRKKGLRLIGRCPLCLGKWKQGRMRRRWGKEWYEGERSSLRLRDEMGSVVDRMLEV